MNGRITSWWEVRWQTDGGWWEGEPGAGFCLFLLHFSPTTLLLLAPQSGALRITPLRDFHPIPIPSQSHPIPSTYSFRAFKPFNGDLKQPKQTKADQCRPRQTKADQGRPSQTKADQGRPRQTKADQGRPRQTKAAQGNPRQTKADKGRPKQVSK